MELRYGKALLAGAAALVPFSAVHAQGAPGDEIVVTANKREESLSKVGLTITAITGEALAERKVTSI